MGNFMRRTAVRLPCLFWHRQNAAGDCAAVEAAQDYGVYQLLFTLIRRNIFYGRKKA